MSKLRPLSPSAFASVPHAPPSCCRAAAASSAPSAASNQSSAERSKRGGRGRKQPLARTTPPTAPSKNVASLNSTKQKKQKSTKEGSRRSCTSDSPMSDDAVLDSCCDIDDMFAESSDGASLPQCTQNTSTTSQRCHSSQSARGSSSREQTSEQRHFARDHNKQQRRDAWDTTTTSASSHNEDQLGRGNQKPFKSRLDATDRRPQYDEMSSYHSSSHSPQALFSNQNARDTEAAAAPPGCWDRPTQMHQAVTSGRYDWNPTYNRDSMYFEHMSNMPQHHHGGYMHGKGGVSSGAAQYMHGTGPPMFAGCGAGTAAGPPHMIPHSAPAYMGPSTPHMQNAHQHMAHVPHNVYHSQMQQGSSMMYMHQDGQHQWHACNMYQPPPPPAPPAAHAARTADVMGRHKSFSRAMRLQQDLAGMKAAQVLKPISWRAEQIARLEVELDYLMEP